jgi:MraZ protein
MTHFLGNHQSKLDAKGRVSVPAPFRAALKAGAATDGAAMILRPSHQHPCIEAWPAAAFHALAAPLDQYDVFSDTQDDLATALYGEACEIEPDKEGRIVLPERLLRHACITETLEFMGIGKIFQIWHPDAAERRRIEARERARSRGLTIPGTGTNGAGTNGAGTNGTGTNGGRTP